MSMRVQTFEFRPPFQSGAFLFCQFTYDFRQRAEHREYGFAHFGVTSAQDFPPSSLFQTSFKSAAYTVFPSALQARATAENALGPCIFDVCQAIKLNTETTISPITKYSFFIFILYVVRFVYVCAKHITGILFGRYSGALNFALFDFHSSISKILRRSFEIA